MSNLNKFFNDLKASKFYNILFKNHNIILGRVGGSRLSNITDNNSDYDLILWTNEDNKVNLEDNFALKYKGAKVHWYYIDIKHLFNFINSSEKYSAPTLLNVIGIVLFYYLTDDKIFYINNDYLKVKEYIMANKVKLANLAANYFIYYTIPLINTAIDTNLGRISYTKLLYDCLICYNVIFNKELDKKFLLAIKRIRWQSISEIDKNKCLDIFKQVQDYSNSINIEEITNYLTQEQEKIKELL